MASLADELQGLLQEFKSQLASAGHEQAVRKVYADFGGANGFDISPWADRVARIDAVHDGAWELPSIGAVAAPTAVLVRPDGHVAWASDESRSGLSEALTTWFGAA